MKGKAEEVNVAMKGARESVVKTSLAQKPGIESVLPLADPGRSDTMSGRHVMGSNACVPMFPLDHHLLTFGVYHSSSSIRRTARTPFATYCGSRGADCGTDGSHCSRGTGYAQWSGQDQQAIERPGIFRPPYLIKDYTQAGTPTIGYVYPETKFSEISDGLSNTFFAGERNADAHWTFPAFYSTKPNTYAVTSVKLKNLPAQRQYHQFG